MILPVGVGFASPGPIGVVGFRIITCCPDLRCLDGLLLAQKLRPLVVADHLRQRNRRIFIHDCAVRLESHRRNARRIDHTLNTSLSRQLQQLPRPIDVGGVHLLRIANPQPIVRRNMHQRIAASERRTQLLRLPQIAGDHLSIDSHKRIQPARLPRQQPKTRTFRRVSPGHMATDKARRSRNEYAHVPLSLNLCCERSE